MLEDKEGGTAPAQTLRSAQGTLTGSKGQSRPSSSVESSDLPKLKVMNGVCMVALIEEGRK